MPDASDEYGAYKIACEQAIQAIDPQAKIVRIGWQIGTEAGSNNMVDFFTNEMKQHGVIQASRNWYPSSSLLEDTAEALVTILLEQEAGLYQLNGNDRYSMYDLAHALNTLHAKNWMIEPVDEPRRDNRMATVVRTIATLIKHPALLDLYQRERDVFYCVTGVSAAKASAGPKIS